MHVHVEMPIFLGVNPLNAFLDILLLSLLHQVKNILMIVYKQMQIEYIKFQKLIIKY